MTTENLIQAISEVLGALASGIAIYNAIQTFLVKQPVSKTIHPVSSRSSFIYATTLLIVGTGVVWILNLASVIKGNWTILLFAILIALSIFLAFFLWAYIDDLAYEMYLSEVRDQLRKKPETGAVVVRARKKLLGQEVRIGYDKTFVCLQRRNGHAIYIAALTNLKYNDNYAVKLVQKKAQKKKLIWVSVRLGQVAEVDWR